MLEVKVLEGGNGGDSRRKISTEIVGPETKDLETIKLFQTVGWEGASESNSRKMNANNLSSIHITSDPNPRRAN